MSAQTLCHVTVFEAETGGYVTYRIPALETAPDGTLLAFAEARKHNMSDPGGKGQEIDLVLKRSEDGGSTWSTMQVVEAAGDNWSSANAATVLDRETGRLWLHYLRCRPGASSGSARPGTDDVTNLARWSDDHGRTWSDPIDLTEIARDMDDPQWRCTVPGPGGAIQDAHGRLVVPCWKSGPRENFVIYSADHGRTWQRSAFVPGEVHGNENQVVERVNGRLLMDIRQSEGDRRWLSESDDGGQTWQPPRPGVVVPPVACAIKRLTRIDEDGDRNRIVWTGPRGPGRENLVARVSVDEGQSFGPERLLCESKAAYSDLTVLADGTLGTLWEKGRQSPYETLTFTALPLSFLEPND